MDDSDIKQKPVHKLRKHFAHKKRFIIWVIVSFVVIAATGVYFVFFNPFNNSQNSNEQAINTAAAKRNETYKETESIVSEQGSQAGQTFLDAELAKTSELKEQAQLYIDKSTIAGSLPGGSDKVKALEYAYKAESLFPNEESALIIALLEENQVNIPNAIKYYKLFIERFPQDSTNAAYSKYDYDYYTARINELEAGK